IVGRVSDVLANPAVTLGRASTGRFPRKDVAPYFVAELLGAILGAAALLAIFRMDAASVGHLGAVKRSAGTNIWPGRSSRVWALSSWSCDERDGRGPALPERLGRPGYRHDTRGDRAAHRARHRRRAVNPTRAFGPDFMGVFTGIQINWLDN